MHDDGDNCQLTMEVPGMKSKNLALSVERDGRVRLTGTRTVVSRDGRVKRHMRFIKHLPLDNGVVDTERLGVRLSRGVLIVSGPKRSSQRRRRVPRRTSHIHESEVSDLSDSSDDDDHDDDQDEGVAVHATASESGSSDDQQNDSDMD